MCVGREVRLPQILQIVIVGRGPTSLNLGENSAAPAQIVEEVRARASDEVIVGPKHHFLVEGQFRTENPRDQGLDRAARRTMDMC